MLLVDVVGELHRLLRQVTLGRVHRANDRAHDVVHDRGMRGEQRLEPSRARPSTVPRGPRGNCCSSFRRRSPSPRRDRGRARSPRSVGRQNRLRWLDDADVSAADVEGSSAALADQHFAVGKLCRQLSTVFAKDPPRACSHAGDLLSVIMWPLDVWPAPARTRQCRAGEANRQPKASARTSWQSRPASIAGEWFMARGAARKPTDQSLQRGNVEGDRASLT